MEPTWRIVLSANEYYYIFDVLHIFLGNVYPMYFCTIKFHINA